MVGQQRYIGVLTDIRLGMFLWVQLMLDMLLEQHSVYDLKNTLDRLPAGLPGLFVPPSH